MEQVGGNQLQRKRKWQLHLKERFHHVTYWTYLKCLMVLALAACFSAETVLIWTSAKEGRTIHCIIKTTRQTSLQNLYKIKQWTTSVKLLNLNLHQMMSICLWHLWAFIPIEVQGMLHSVHNSSPNLLQNTLQTLNSKTPHFPFT